MSNLEHWSHTTYLGATSRDKAASTNIQMRHAGFMKRVLGVKRSVPQHIALKEKDQFPIHYHWLKTVI